MAETPGWWWPFLGAVVVSAGAAFAWLTSSEAGIHADLDPVRSPWPPPPPNGVIHGPHTAYIMFDKPQTSLLALADLSDLPEEDRAFIARISGEIETITAMVHPDPTVRAAAARVLAVVFDGTHDLAGSIEDRDQLMALLNSLARAAAVHATDLEPGLLDGVAG